MDKFGVYLLWEKRAIEEALEVDMSENLKKYFEGRLEEIKEIIKKYAETKNAQEAATSKGK